MVMQGLFFSALCIFHLEFQRKISKKTLNFHSLCSLRVSIKKAALFLCIPTPHFYFDTFCSAYFIHNADSPVRTETPIHAAVMLQHSAAV